MDIAWIGFVLLFRPITPPKFALRDWFCYVPSQVGSAGSSLIVDFSLFSPFLHVHFILVSFNMVTQALGSSVDWARSEISLVLWEVASSKQTFETIQTLTELCVWEMFFYNMWLVKPEVFITVRSSLTLFFKLQTVLASIWEVWSWWAVNVWMGKDSHTILTFRSMSKYPPYSW